MAPKPTGRRVSRTRSIQAPTGGLNAKDPVAAMKETEAVTLENWFPSQSSVDIRKGMTAHLTGVSDPVETLALYNDGITPELFAVAGGNIYDATTAGAVGAAVVTGLTNSRFQTINMGTAGGFFLMMVNGADKLQYYTGSAWDEDGAGSLTITGVDTADCVHINNFKNRVWLIEKESFNAWYLPVSSIAGAASKFDLSGLFKLGGYLMAMANWTIDNASGVDDYAAFITSEGEVALYKGTDPSSATTWAIVGTFRMGRPIGRRCFTKAGADVLVLTTDGAFPLSKALLTDRSQLNLAATDKISSLFNTDIQAYGSIYGWQPIIHPFGKKLIINVPTTETLEAHQYVMNTSNGSWTKFTGWNAICFEVLGDNLYYGASDGVYQADVGSSDNGAVINAVAQQAYSYFGNQTGIKKWTMARCVFISDGVISPAVLLNVDFAENRTVAAPSFTDNLGSEWDVAEWDIASWTRGDNIIKNWQTVTGVGYSGGIRVVTSTMNITCKWVSTDFVYELGGVL
jgi:hypothetical protein